MNSINGKIFTGSDSFASISSATTTTCYTPASGKKVLVTGFMVSTTGANVITLEIASVIFAKYDLAANGGANVSSDFPIAIGAVDAQIKVITTGSTTAYVSFWGNEI